MNKRKRSYSDIQPDGDYVPENEAESSDSDYHKPTNDSVNNKLIHSDSEVNPLRLWKNLLKLALHWHKRKTYTKKGTIRQDINVCKIFFVATLGYPPENDRILKTLRKNELGSVAPKPDQRGRHPNKTKIDEFTISEHILSFRPTISHYRREHAPNRLYLPSDISVVKMYNDFKEKHPNFKISYNVYRLQVKKLNISFKTLGCEECFSCGTYIRHEIESKHDGNNLGCEICSAWKFHHEKYTTSSEEYQKDGAIADAAEATEERYSRCC
ncbi:hypothetical protein QE152_g31269 [Popillia japonica]|uniref:C2H2-type domain-containing protein n=1 Tax=Popillia japonica TaxID=7064 RepID=A0AAW1JBS0_POPJA